MAVVECATLTCDTVCGGGVQSEPTRSSAGTCRACPAPTTPTPSPPAIASTAARYPLCAALRHVRYSDTHVLRAA
eukprot:3725655-Rhodomonas_salina.1